MFTDVTGFTGISEELGSRVVPVLAEYLEAVSTAVLNHCGTIDKFLGDGVWRFGVRRCPVSDMLSMPAPLRSNAKLCSPCSGLQPSVAAERHCGCALASTLAACWSGTLVRARG
jgi:class 3 adenylate cyclase